MMALTHLSVTARKDHVIYSSSKERTKYMTYSKSIGRGPLGNASNQFLAFIPMPSDKQFVS